MKLSVLLRVYVEDRITVYADERSRVYEDARVLAYATSEVVLLVLVAVPFAAHVPASVGVPCAADLN